MSFLIAVHVHEGIVLASDRRTTYNTTYSDGNKITTINGVHTTDSTDKTFVCPNGAGISTCGEAALLQSPITGYIKDAIRSKISKETLIEDIPNILIEYFNRLKIVPNTNFIVAGYKYNNDVAKQVIYKVNVKTKKVDDIDTSAQGAIWDGETCTLTRLINAASVKLANNQYADLPQEQILFEYFTMQDAVDFARFAVETTIKTLRFKNVVETVGGDVDILIIRPSGCEWLQKKELV